MGDAVSEGVEVAVAEPVIDADAPRVIDAVGDDDGVGVAVLEPVGVCVGEGVPVEVMLGVRVGEGGAIGIAQTVSAVGEHACETVRPLEQEEHCWHGMTPLVLQVLPATHDGGAEQTVLAVAEHAETCSMPLAQAAHCWHGATPLVLQELPPTHGVGAHAPLTIE